ncbi:Trypsin [Popillia japonica]|uniref:Trypsin n=1 Tax=Popillia japonica TaxID=7064 RepID=A0AAW1LME0_POPJA
MSHFYIIYIILSALGQNVFLSASPKSRPKIVSGEDVDITLVPYTVSIFESGTYVCVGSYILPVWVLTAAHCVESQLPKDKNVVNSNKLLLKMGSTHLVDDSAQLRRSVMLIAHEKYRQTVHAFDIALINLSKQFLLGDKVGMIPLVTKEIYAQLVERSSTAMVAGWGFKTYLGDGHADVIQAVRIKLLLQEDCQKMFRMRRLSNDSICAGNSNDTRDACHGDSGAALVLEDPLVQVGLVSWGIGCGTHLPGIYTNVYYHKDWISTRSAMYVFNNVNQRSTSDKLRYIFSLLVLNII